MEVTMKGAIILLTLAIMFSMVLGHNVESGNVNLFEIPRYLADHHQGYPTDWKISLPKVGGAIKREMMSMLMTS
jgi:hypothetical protein